jgi:hypothetical protein
MFKSKALIKIFGPTRNEVTKDGRKLHDEKCHNNMHSSFNIVRMIKWGMFENRALRRILGP